MEKETNHVDQKKVVGDGGGDSVAGWIVQEEGRGGEERGTGYVYPM